MEATHAAPWCPEWPDVGRRLLVQPRVSLWHRGDCEMSDAPRNEPMLNRDVITGFVLSSLVWLSVIVVFLVLHTWLHIIR
jgi:hypothetical protein